MATERRDAVIGGGRQGVTREKLRRRETSAVSLNECPAAAAARRPDGATRAAVRLRHAALCEPVAAPLATPAQAGMLRLASITVSAAMFTIRRTVALDVRMFTGALTPSRNGPTATLLPASVLSRL